MVWKKVSESAIFPHLLSFWEVFTSALRELGTLPPVDGAQWKGLSLMREQEGGRLGGTAQFWKHRGVLKTLIVRDLCFALRFSTRK